MVTAIGITLVALWALVIYGINRRYSDRVRPEHVAMAAAMTDDDKFAVGGDFTLDPEYSYLVCNVNHHDD